MATTKALIVTQEQADALAKLLSLLPRTHWLRQELAPVEQVLGFDFHMRKGVDPYVQAKLDGLLDLIPDPEEDAEEFLMDEMGAVVDDDLLFQLRNQTR